MILPPPYPVVCTYSLILCAFFCAKYEAFYRIGNFVPYTIKPSGGCALRAKEDGCWRSRAPARRIRQSRILSCRVIG